MSRLISKLLLCSISPAFPSTTGVLLDFSFTVKAATLIFISGRGSAISSAKKGKSGFIYNLVKYLKPYRQTVWTQIRLLL